MNPPSQHNEPSFLAFLLAAPVLLLVLYGSCAMKGWRYDECLKVGHSQTYCDAEYVGCVGGGRR